jgi:hypothetical protein
MYVYIYIYIYIYVCTYVYIYLFIYRGLMIHKIGLVELAQVVECLPSKSEALSSNPRAAKNI